MGSTPSPSSLQRPDSMSKRCTAGIQFAVDGGGGGSWTCHSLPPPLNFHAEQLLRRKCATVTHPRVPRRTILCMSQRKNPRRSIHLIRQLILLSMPLGTKCIQYRRIKLTCEATGQFRPCRPDQSLMRNRHHGTSLGFVTHHEISCMKSSPVCIR